MKSSPRFGRVYFGRCDAVQYAVSPIAAWWMTLTCVSGVWTGLMVSNAHTWVTWERERERDCVWRDSPLFSHCGKLNVNEQSVWRLPAAGYKSPLQAHTHKHTVIHFKIAHNRNTYKDWVTQKSHLPTFMLFLFSRTKRRCFTESSSCSVTCFESEY